MTEWIEFQDIPVPGVRSLDHTADVGLEILAPDLPELFGRAALGAMWLVSERPPIRSEDSAISSPPIETRPVEMAEDELETLFRFWLKTLLFWEETEEFVVVEAKLAFLPVPSCGSSTGQAFGLRGEVLGWVDMGPRIREIKGVTLHGLKVEQRTGGWYGRVIFDV